MLSFFPRGVLDEILNLIESVSEGFPSYSFIRLRPNWGQILGSLTISLSLLCMGLCRGCWKVLLFPWDEKVMVAHDMHYK